MFMTKPDIATGTSATALEELREEDLASIQGGYTAYPVPTYPVPTLPTNPLPLPSLPGVPACW